MKLSRRDEKPADVLEPDEPVDPVDEDSAVALGKGRPTPKRRESQGRRGPVSAPKTRKEAMARQRQLAKEQKTARASAPPRSAAEQRAALKRGDPDALPRRDQGPTRKLARDYVDSHRMLSGYFLLAALILLIASTIINSFVQLAAIVALLLFVAEGWIVGRRVRALAIERYGKAEGGNFTVGLYCASRAYLPRKWRLPGPQVERGDEI